MLVANRLARSAMKHRTFNWIAAVACLGCGIGYTVEGRPLNAIAMLVILGLVNLAFILAR
jgi:hypothetical protein